MSFLTKFRTGFWHLRKGGVAQVRTWLRRQRVAAVTAGTPVHGTDGLHFEPLVALAHRSAARPRVAVILDPFSASAFSSEFELIHLRPDAWVQQLAESSPVCILVESAWAGNDGAWRYHLAGESAPRPALRDLLEAARERGIPSVFWNKEDPPHFEDFVETAKLFDQVFTTDTDLLPEYRRRLGHDRVGVLGFAAQPAIHNPVRLKPGHQERDVAFAGMYFRHKYPERREQMDLLLGGALDVSHKMPIGLEIFSRFQGGDVRYQFPGELADRVVGSLPYEEMLTAYKAYKVFLNVNSVVDSPSMCSRRVFEILASGTPVISTRSVAIPEFFPEDLVPIADSREEAGHLVRAFVNSQELRDRTVHLAQRSIWEQHTYAHRARQILEAVGVDVSVPKRPSVSALISTNRPHQVEHALASAGAQRGVEVQAVLVTHGFELPAAETKAKARDLGVEHLHLHSMPADRPLGACLRSAVEAADGDVMSKMDDDDLYGEHYLADLLHALTYSGADVVGKQAHYMHLRNLDATMLRFPEREHCFTDLVMGPTITGLREAFEAVAFADLARGEGTNWLHRVLDEGMRIYSADRFNFVQVRASGHTWDVGDTALLATGEVKFYGDPAAHVMV